MKTTFIILTTLLILVSCSNNTKTNSTKKIDRSIDIPEPDILERLTYQKNMIDTLISNDKLQLESYYKEYNSDKIKKRMTKQISENTEATYAIWRNAKGAIQIIGKYPYSQSGDWNAACLHYFDDKGLTFSSVNTTSFFVEDTIMGKKTITEYYNGNFKKIDSIFFTNQDGKKHDNAYNMYNFSCTVSRSSAVLLKSLGIENQNIN